MYDIVRKKNLGKMSRIDQLSIQGIRNFSSENAEVIRFEPPVTLILGKNGSGKTTIIESLKYATTGEMPAGTNRGQSFIHDPKLSTKKMSIGCVKLQFFDEHNNKFIVTRSMEARILKSKLDFKTIDGTISKVQSDGTLKSHKNKNNDLNTFVCNTLGVSKALLNNVLFCHQEDSNWPLDEAKKVKDKFDDIFNTTRYVKCQDEIRKQIIEVKAKMKDIEKMVDRYKMQKDQAEEFQNDQRRQTERKANLEAEMQQLQQNKAELEAKLKQLKDQYKEAERMKGEIQKKKTRMEELERNRHDLESDITRVIAASVEELELEIRRFQMTKGDREKELNILHRELQQVDQEGKANAAAQQEQLVQLGKLQSEEEQHNNRIKQRDTLLINLAHRYKWDKDSAPFPSNEPLNTVQVSRYKSLLKQTVEQEKQKESVLKQELDVEERNLLNSLNKLREGCVRLEQDIKTKESSLSSFQREVSEIEAKLGAMEENSRQVNLLERQQVDAQALVDRAKRELNEAELIRDIDRAKSEKMIQEAELDHLRSQLKKVMSQRDIRVKLDMHQKDLSGKKTQERRLMSRETVEDAIKILVGDNGNKDNLLSYYNGRLNSITTSLSKKQQSLTKLGQEGATCQANLKNFRNQLEAKQNELAAYQQKLKDAGSSGAAELESDISRLALEIQDLDDQRGLVHGSEKMYHHFIDKMEKQRAHSDCPLCHREFDDSDEAQMLKDEMKNRVEAMPAKKADLDRKIVEKKNKHGQLLQLRPVAQSVAKLTEVEIPRLQTGLQDLESRSNTIQAELRDLEESIEFLKNEEDIGKKAHPDIIQLDALKNDIKKLQSQVDSIQAQLGLSGSEGDLTVEEVQEQVEKAEATYRSTTQSIESMNERYNEHQSKLTQLQKNVNGLMERKLQLNNNLQQRGNFLERKSTLETDIEQALFDIEEWKQKLEPMVAKQLAAQAAHSDAQKRRSVLTEQARSKIEELLNQLRGLASLDKEIEKWGADGKVAQLRHSQQEVDRLKTEKLALEQRKKEIQEKIKKLELALSNCENEERNLRNNLKLIVNTTDREVVKQELEDFNSKLETFKLPQLIKEIQRLEGQLESCKIKLGELGGTFQEIQKSIRELEVKLQREEFATAEERYLDQVKDYEVHQAINEDLGNFYNALESALMKFHKERMSVINRMVREMWHSTYKGKDIDYVEIRAEESAGTSGNTRRQYNYRVVMVKNGVEMDMRGRCSAGQKVLASLIIRMALAEAFSSKCGVLALDEPTTNLDEDNIASLSDTILELSNAITRQKRKFQLIVITHDEKFLERMSRDKRMERFYRVDRNRFNMSEIRQFDVMGGSQSTNIAKKMLK